jgi:hypothetical protein
MTRLSAALRCTGMTPALAAVARPSANIVPNMSVFVIVFLLEVGPFAKLQATVVGFDRARR